MADDLKDRGAQDRNRVNINEDHEVRDLDAEVGCHEGTVNGGRQESRRLRGCRGEGAREEVTVLTNEFYRSSNGDRWQLVRDTENGQRTVRHEPNLSSGGRVTDYPVEEWLDRTGTSPENQALRALMEKLSHIERDE